MNNQFYAKVANLAQKNDLEFVLWNNGHIHFALSFRVDAYEASILFGKDDNIAMLFSNNIQNSEFHHFVRILEAESRMLCVMLNSTIFSQDIILGYAEPVFNVFKQLKQAVIQKIENHCATANKKNIVETCRNNLVTNIQKTIDATGTKCSVTPGTGNLMFALQYKNQRDFVSIIIGQDVKYSDIITSFSVKHVFTDEIVQQFVDMMNKISSLSVCEKTLKLDMELYKLVHTFKMVIQDIERPVKRNQI